MTKFLNYLFSRSTNNSRASKQGYLLPVILGCLFCFYSSLVSAYQKNKVYRYSVVHIADTHGHFWEDALGQGGFAYVKTIIENIRKEGNPVLVFHAGDFNTGYPDSDILLAEPDIYAINNIGFDAVTAGNHEFDLPIEDLRKQIEALRPPLLSANALYVNPETSEETYFFKPYTIIEKGDLRFLVIGLTSVATKWQSNPFTTEHFKFIDPYQAFTRAVQLAEENHEKYDLIIGLNHLGFHALGEHGDEPYGDFTLAQKLPTGLVSLFVTANSHNFACVNQFGQEVFYRATDRCNVPYSNLMPIVASYRNGIYVGRADFEFENGVSKMVNYQLIPINVKERLSNGEYIDLGNRIKPEASLYYQLKLYKERAQKQLNTKVGSLSAELPMSREHETKLGTLVAKAQAQKVNADVGILNAGSLRAGLPKGDVTYFNILNTEPYDNVLITVELTGQELIDYINTIFLYQNSRLPNYYGVTFKASRKSQKTWDFKVAGKALDKDKTYRLVVSSYLAGGGDQYPNILENPTVHISDTVEYLGLRDYLEKHQLINVDNLSIDGPNWEK